LRTLYTIAFTVLIPLVLLRLCWRGLKNRGYFERWRERFGLFDRPRPAAGGVWIHAVSVGEATAAGPIVKALKEPGLALPVVMTTTTASGADMVTKKFAGVVQQFCCPYDLPFAVERFLDFVRPRLLLLMETELWPNMIAACRARRIPVVMANARLSENSLRGYKMAASLVAEMLDGVDGIAAQSEVDAQRFRELGVDPDRIMVSGSLKFDCEIPPSVFERAEALRRALGTDRNVFMAGSTREGEEEILLDAFAAVQKHYPDCLMIIAPRHPERFDAVEQLLVRRGLRYVCRSDQAVCGPETEIFLLDTMGELLGFYAAADIAFVGGSLVPIGGHNVLEPAGVGVPVMIGPHVFNFPDAATLLAAAGALRTVRNSADIVACAIDWFADSNARDQAGSAGKQVVMANSGAIGEVMNQVRRLLAEAP
jgi:3-deoxy-D-manno-octulosonic-acid transferase